MATEVFTRFPVLAGKSADLFPNQSLTLAHKVGQSLEPTEFNFNLFWH
jgi:hypothetical protein